MDAVEFGTILTGAATGALPYLGAGVGAGAVIFAAWLGISKGLKGLKKISS